MIEKKFDKSMKVTDINIRDPYILNHNNKYYLYGTRSETTWGKADGFDCYVSSDLVKWEGPIEIFSKPEGFWADQNYWAPECYAYNGKFYLVTTLGAQNRKKAIYILESDSPIGPFRMYTDKPISPTNWTCIDGSLYFEEDGTPYLLFSHSFEDIPDGDMCVIKLSNDLKKSIGEPIKLFNAKEAPWALPVPFAKQEFNMDGDVYFTDGPCSFRGESGRLYIIWSSWVKRGYGMGVAYSESGSILGPWKHEKEALYSEDGGHGMAFRNMEGEWHYTFHYPNDFTKERPVFKKIQEINNRIILK